MTAVNRSDYDETTVRRNHSPAFKAKVGLAAIKCEKTLVDLAQQFDVHLNLITQWHGQLDASISQC